MPVKLRSATRIRNSAGSNVVKTKEVVLVYKTNELVSLRQHYGVPQGQITAFQALLHVVDAERARLHEIEEHKDTTVLSGNTTEIDDDVYGAVDEGSVALGDVRNEIGSNGAQQNHNPIDVPDVPSYRCGTVEPEALNKPKASPVLATSQSTKDDKRRARVTRSKKNKRPAGPAAGEKKHKDKIKERTMNTGPSDEATGKPTRSGGDVDEVAVHPPKISRPRVRLFIREEKYNAAVKISRQGKGESCADETTPPPLVVPDGMRELRRRRLVSTETPISRPRIRRQPETLPVTGKGTMKGEKKEQPMRGNKRTRRDFEDDDAPEDTPPRKRTKQAHSLEGSATSLDVMV